MTISKEDDPLWTWDLQWENEKWQLQNMNESYARRRKQQLFKRYYFLLKTVIEKVNV